jgi:D-alanyl-lipoteichoic acid acyltransferase DltB (MBOAT superfamily)
MLFNSIEFFVFLPLVFFLYWILQKQKLSLQNGLLLVGSYYFYACWDWRFLFLLMLSTGLDYLAGLMMQKAKKEANRKFWFWLTISINIGFLGVFKYYNFFVDSFANLIGNFGFQVHYTTLNIILPVGISFYTFHGLSYVIDIYKRRIKPEHNFVEYALFVSYFPLLVAGPIERATHLLPQIKKKRNFDYHKAIQGVKQIIWGLFKKVVVADNCAFFVNQIFDNSADYSAPELCLGSILFAFQIYGDFSGYSDIALGTSKLFGIDLLRNFNFPYFSKDIADFWRRWHISLSTWFRDYLYIPLGGSRGSKWQSVKNTFIIFLVSGFWHGANWTFIIWGLIHAILFMPLLLSDSNRSSLHQVGYKMADIFKISSTFVFVCIAWIFFRADSLKDAWIYFNGMIDFSDLSYDLFIKNSKYSLLTGICFLSIFCLLQIEWKNVKNNNYEIQLNKIQLITLICMIFFMGAFKNQLSFIYFQF